MKAPHPAWGGCTMARIASLYPPNPRDLPADLTVPSFRYRAQVLVMLVSLLVFFLLYVGLVVASAYLVYWSITFPIPRLRFPRGNWFAAAAKIGAIGGAVLLFLFLLKGLVKRQHVGPSPLVEL